MLKWLGGLMDRVFAVAGAVIFAQLPLFMQQYTQQLVGRESELRMQVDAMRHAASITGKTLEQIIGKFLASSDVDFVNQGEVMLSLVGRWHSLSESLTAMQRSSVWERPFAFIAHMNLDTFKSTVSHFTMGIPINAEGGIYALIGIAVGYLVFAAVRKVWRKITAACMRPFRRQPKSSLEGEILKAKS